MLDYLEEYEDMDSINPKVAVTYKFLALFKVHTEGSKRGLYWCHEVDKDLPDDVLLALKAYLKEMRSRLKEELNVKHSKIIWFFYQKLLEVSAFDNQIRMEIRGYLDLCQYILL